MTHGRSRSRSRAAARRELHEQLVDAPAARRRCREQWALALADLGPGTAADLCLLRLTRAPGRRPRARRCSAPFSRAGGACSRAPALTTRRLAGDVPARAADGARRSTERSSAPRLEPGSRRAAAGWNAGWAAEFAAQAPGAGAHVHARDSRIRRRRSAIVSRFLDRRTAEPDAGRCGRGRLRRAVDVSVRRHPRSARARPAGARAALLLRLRRRTSSASCASAVVIGARLLGAVPLGCTRCSSARSTTDWTRDMTEERDAIAHSRRRSISCSSSLLALVSLVADFAKVRAVVEDRRSMLGALGASLRFIRRRPFRVAGAVSAERHRVARDPAALAAVAPPAAAAPLAGAAHRRRSICCCACGRSSRSWRRRPCSSRASSRTRDYTAAPEPVWPDSPAAEAIDEPVATWQSRGSSLL